MKKIVAFAALFIAALFLVSWSVFAQSVSACGQFDLPCWSTSGRPFTPSAGTFGYNTDTKILEFWNGSAWVGATDGTVNVKSCGAKGDNSTDDIVAINTCIAYAHTLGTATLKPVKIYFPPANYVISDSINGTGWTDTVVPNNNGPAVVFEGYGAWIVTSASFVAGHPVMDFMGSSLVKINGFSIFSNCSGAGSLATTGIQIGRRQPALTAQNNSIQDVAIEGCYSIAPFYNYASEVFVAKNLNTLAFGTNSQYNAVIDCDNHFNITSPFVSITPGQAHASCTGMSFYGGSFQAVLSGGSTATNSIGMFISSDAEELTFDNVYWNTATTTCFQINADNVASTDRFRNIRIRGHCEAGAIASTFRFTGARATLNVQDFHYSDDDLFATTSLFAIGSGGISLVNISSMDVNVATWVTAGAHVFDDTTKYTASGRYTSSTSAQWNVPSAWSGCVTLALVTSCANNSVLDPTIWGAKCDGATDDSAAFNNAIATLTTGGTILVPPRICAIASTINIANTGIIIQGVSGPQSHHDAGTPQITSGFKWTGAGGGTMVSVSTPGSSTEIINGNQLRNLQLLGNDTAGTGLLITSNGFGTFSDLYIKNTTSVGIDMTVTVTVSEAHSNCRNNFTNVQVDQLSSASDSAIGIRLTGIVAEAMNTCLNTFKMTRVTHKNGHGIFCDFCDHNVFTLTDVFHRTNGTGDAVRFDSKDASHYAQGNSFYMLSVSNSLLTTSVTGAASGTGSVIRLAVSSSTNFSTGDNVTVTGVGGTVEANGIFTITNVDSTHIELNSTKFVNAWTSGGTVTNNTCCGKVRSTGFAKGNTIIMADAYTPTPPPFIDSSSALNFQYENAPYFLERPKYKAGFYYLPMYTATISAAGTALVQDNIVCHQGVVPTIVTINTLGAVVTTASVAGNVQFAIYSTNPVDNFPGLLLAQTGDISTNVGAPAEIHGALLANVQVGPGTPAGSLLWFCANSQNGVPAFQATNTATRDLMMPMLTGNTTPTGTTSTPTTAVGCAGADCQGGVSTYNTWPAVLSGSTWGNEIRNDNHMALISFKVLTSP